MKSDNLRYGINIDGKITNAKPCNNQKLKIVPIFIKWKLHGTDKISYRGYADAPHET